MKLADTECCEDTGVHCQLLYEEAANNKSKTLLCERVTHASKWHLLSRLEVMSHIKFWVFDSYGAGLHIWLYLEKLILREIVWTGYRMVLASREYEKKG